MMRREYPLKLNRLPVRLLLGTLVFGALWVDVSAQQKNALALSEPHLMREDFQGDGLGQWASYPPAQDVGYEPSLSPTSDYDAPGGRALMRVVKPNRTGSLRFGFIKKAPMTLTGDGRLRFAYRLNVPAGGATLEIGVAGSDGSPYTTRIPVSTNRWDVAEIALDKLRSPEGRAPGNGMRMDALYTVAHLSSADADTTYRFMIDDLTLAAAREASFDVRIPATVRIEPWTSLVSAKGYRSGETIAISALAPARLARARCVLMSHHDEKTVAEQQLYDDGTHGDGQAGDGVWTNSSVYTLRHQDAAGLWVAQLSGTTADGLSVNTPVRFIVRRQEAGESHPRLYFSPADREALIARSRNPRLTSLWEHLETTAKNTRASGEVAHGGRVFEMLDTEYLLPSLLGYFDVLNRARARIAHNSLEAYVTGREESRSAAKSALLDVARWKTWTPPWFKAHGQHTYYPAGLLAADAALGYDLLYEHLSAEERSLVRRALVEKCIAPTFKEYVADNRVMANTSNWIAHTVGGALIAATAIAGDVTEEEAGGRFEVYLNGLLLKLEDHIAASYLRDGSYGEGISYHEFDMETLAPAAIALKRNFGIDYLRRTHVMESLSYPLYTLAWPTSASLDMGDTHAPAGHGIPGLVYQSEDPVIRWYYGQFERPSLHKFIFFDERIAPRSPAEASLPTSRIFTEKGNAVFRTGWERDDWVFLYRAGPNFNHHHADQGAFLLNAFGEQLVTEAGWSDYYKDPYYATFFTQAVGHSTLLVDGNPESQLIADTPQFPALDAYPRITDAVTSDFYDALGSELSSVYDGRLSRYTRRVAFVKPHYFVIFDDLATNGAPARFDWLLHLPDRARIKHSPGLALYTGERAALAVRNFAPEDTELQVRDGRVPYHVFAARTPPAAPAQPAFLDWRNTSPAQATQFLFALVPARKAEEAQGLAGRMSRVAGERTVGLSSERGAERDFVMFRTGGAGGVVRQGEWTADADAWTVTLDGERLKMLAAQSALSLTRGGRTLFTSEARVSFAANYHANAVEVACHATSQAKIQLFVGAEPVRVLLDGREVSARYDRDGATISLTVPAGQHQLKIALK
jgi:hypothetical protein